MANTLLNIDMITNESLMVLTNNLVFTKGVNSQYSNQFARSGAKIGDTVNVRLPDRAVVSDGAAIDIRNVTDTSVAIQLAFRKHTAFTFSSQDLALSIDEFSMRYIQPRVAALANQIDYDGMNLYKSVYNAVGTAATTPTALLTYLLAGVKLDNNAAPMAPTRSCIVDPMGQATIVDSLKGLFQSSEQIKSQYERGKMGVAAGFDWGMDQNVRRHTVGTYAGTPLTNGAGVEGASTLVTDGWSSTSLKQGDVFTIGTTASKGVYAVNPQNRQSTGQLAQFVVTADISDTAGDMTIAISPALNSTGAYQNIDALPQDGAAITLVGATGVQSPQYLAHHRDAFAFVTADLERPGGVDMVSVKRDPQLGISLRLVRDYDINTDLFPCRIDVLYGWKCIRPELACRIYA